MMGKWMMRSGSTMTTKVWQGVVWKKRKAWWFTATARTKERYARSKLGNIWIGLSTLLTSVLLGVVYGNLFKVKDPLSFFIYIALGLTTWNALATSIGNSPNMFRNNQILLKNTNIHPAFFAFEEWAFNMIELSQSMGFITIAVVLIQPEIALNILLWGWLPIINLCVAMFWIPVLCGVASVRYEDFFQIVPLALQLSFLLAPVLYTKEALGSTQWIADINFLYQIINSVRSSFLGDGVDLKITFTLCLINCIGTLTTMGILDKFRYGIRSYV